MHDTFSSGHVVTINFARQMNPGPKSTNSGVASAAIAQAEWSMVSLVGGTCSWLLLVHPVHVHGHYTYTLYMYMYT